MGGPKTPLRGSSATTSTTMAGAASIKMMITNLTEKAVVSQDLVATRGRVLSLYRDILRHIPWIKQTYKVKYSEPAMTAVVRALFREKAHVNDVEEVNRLVKKGRMDFEEVLHVWSGDMHVNAFFDKYLEVKEKDRLRQSDFVTKFYAGLEN